MKHSFIHKNFRVVNGSSSKVFLSHKFVVFSGVRVLLIVEKFNILNRTLTF